MHFPRASTARCPARCNHIARGAVITPETPGGEPMTIKVGDRLPAGTLMEYYDVEKDGCSVGPNPVTIESLTRGKKIVLFGLPGAFTPTCSAKHVPSYLAGYDKLKAKGVDTIACMSVNDAFVMGAWGRDQHASGKVRML